MGQLVGATVGWQWWASPARRVMTQLLVHVPPRVPSRVVASYRAVPTCFKHKLQLISVSTAPVPRLQRTASLFPRVNVIYII